MLRITRHHPRVFPSGPERHAIGVMRAAVVAMFAVAHAAYAGVVPRHDHVIVVVMENKSYDEVRYQPYTASLVARGAEFADSHAVTHPSQPNYLALWAADDLGVRDNACPPSGSPFLAENLGHACEAAGLSWRAYSENLAFAGSMACSYEGDNGSGLYTRKHEPWTQFGNLDHTCERPYADLAADIAAGRLPRLAFVVPNNCHNSHNSDETGCGIAEADAWLAANVPMMIDAAGPRGLVVVTWDEDDSSTDNHVLTVFAGGLVIPGSSSNRHLTHQTVVRTIADALGLPPFGGASSEAPIDGVWFLPTPVLPASWGALKLTYR